MKKKFAFVASGLFTALLLGVGSMQVSADETKIAINTTNFGDTALCEYIKANVDTNKDNYLTEIESKAVTQLTLSKGDYRTITGLDYFKNLETVTISENAKLEDVELDSQSSIKKLQISNNASLANVSASNMGQLKEAMITSNAKLTNADLSGNQELEKLTENGNALKLIDINKSNALTEISLDKNTYADLSACKQLSKVEGNYYTLFAKNGIDVTKMTSVKNNNDVRKVYTTGNEFVLTSLPALADSSKIKAQDGTDYDYDGATATITCKDTAVYPVVVPFTYEVNGKEVALKVEIHKDKTDFVNAETVQVSKPGSILYLDVDPTIANGIFSSNNDGVATVDNKGFVTTVNPGKTRIVAGQGETQKTFELTVARDLHDTTVTATLTDKSYNGKAQTIKPVIQYGNEKLTENVDYKLVYEDNVNAGTAVVKIVGMGNYTGTLVREFVINAQSIIADTVRYSSVSTQTFAAAPICPEPVITWSGVLLVKDKDYKLTYENNTNKGKATITITGMGNFTGTKTMTFNIKRKPLSDNDINYAALEKMAYPGSALEPNMDITYHGVKLVLGVDYTLTYDANSTFGTATVVAHGINNYTNNHSLEFQIIMGKTNGLKVSSRNYNSIRLSWTKVPGAYAYRIYRYNPKTNKYSHIATSKSNTYTNKSLKYGTSYKYKVRAYKTINGVQSFGAYSSVVTTSTKKLTVTKPKKASIRLKAGRRRVTVRWNKISGATGYKVYMATSKKGTYKLVSTRGKNSYKSYVKKSLKKGKRYYFKVRAYKKVSGFYFYGSYSSIKSVKVK
ncbi:O-acetylhomoserine sulfhydrylase [Lachnospiraceae bacterium KM106-2]|nr:O-acetylhomoserine sulfhydrylase [Lachnospiraceae bacterium KM106-2]